MKNHFTGLEDFMRRWDEGSAAANDSSFMISELGNINVEGSSASCALAAAFAPRDPQFEASLEPRIRSLVLTVIARLGCVTYSSCEGHQAAHPGARFATRHVGIVARTDDEHTRLLAVLRRVETSARERIRSPAVRAVIVPRTLTSETGERRCLDIEFAPVVWDEGAYFADVDAVTHVFESSLASVVPA